MVDRIPRDMTFFVNGPAALRAFPKWFARLRKNHDWVNAYVTTRKGHFLFGFDKNPDSDWTSMGEAGAMAVINAPELIDQFEDLVRKGLGWEPYERAETDAGE